MLKPLGEGPRTAGIDPAKGRARDPRLVVLDKTFRAGLFEPLGEDKDKKVRHIIIFTISCFAEQNFGREWGLIAMTWIYPCNYGNQYP